MVGVPTGVVERVFGHELDHLQRALLAVDVRELHVRFERLHLTGGSCRVNEEAVGQHRDLWWILNQSRHGPRSSLRVSCRNLRVDRQFRRRIDGQRHAVVARVVDRLLNLDVELLTACGLGDDVARLSPVGIRTAARPGLLWITALVFVQPRSGLDQSEMGERDALQRHG
jgi:hypothetical protein